MQSSRQLFIWQNSDQSAPCLYKLETSKRINSARYKKYQHEIADISELFKWCVLWNLSWTVPCYIIFGCLPSDTFLELSSCASFSVFSYRASLVFLFAYALCCVHLDPKLAFAEKHVLVISCLGTYSPLVDPNSICRFRNRTHRPRAQKSVKALPAAFQLAFLRHKDLLKR